MKQTITPRERAEALAGLAFVQLFFGVHYFAAKIVLEEIAPRAWAALRATGAALVLLLLVRVLRRRLPLSRTDYARLALYAVFGVVINQVFFVERLSRSSAIHSSIIMSGIPVGTLLFAVLLRREKLTLQKVFSLAASFAGVMLVTRPEAFRSPRRRCTATC